jgi:hypothetical protein
MNLIIQIIVIIIAFILISKLIQLVGGFTKVFYAIYSKVISPIKLFIIWEIKLIKIIIKNLLYAKEDIFTSLKTKQVIGVVKPKSVHNIPRNPLFKSIFILAGQFELVDLFLNRNSFENKLYYVCWACVAIGMGIIFGGIAYYVNRNKINKNTDAFNFSTLGAVVDVVRINVLSETEVRGILSHLQFKTSLEIATKAKAGINSYPLLMQYFNELTLSLRNIKYKQGLITKYFYDKLPLWLLKKVIKNGKLETNVYLYQSFVELISYLNTNRNVKASVVELGHGGVSVLEHSLNVAECSLELFSNEIFKPTPHLKDFAVLTCLAHDIGKIKCHIDGQSNFNGHERQSYQILGLFESFAKLGDSNPHLKDTVTTAILKQNDLIVNDMNEDLVKINHIYKTSDQKASEVEGHAMTEDRINEIYRTAFYILLTDKVSMSRCASLVNGFLFLDVQKFVSELIKFTGQTFTVDNYANTQVFKQIKKFMLGDGLFADGCSDVCSIVMHDIKSGNPIKRYQQCLILRMDFIVQNENIKLDNVYVNAEANNKIIAKVLFQNGAIQFVKSVDTSENISKTITTTTNVNNQDADIHIESSGQLANIDISIKAGSNNKIDNATVVESENISEISIMSTPQQVVYDSEPKIIKTNKPEQKSFNKIWTLDEVNNYFITALQNVGIEIQEIAWNQRNQRYKVKSGYGISATVTAFIEGQIQVHYSIYEQIDYQDHTAKESKKLTLPSGKRWTDASIEYYLKQIDWGNNDIDSESVPYLKRLKLGFNIKDHVTCGVYRDKFAVMVKNFNNSNNGLMMCSLKDIVVEENKSLIILNALNYVMIGTEDNFRIVNQVYLVDNLADALILYNVTNVNVIIYFSAERIIDKIREIYPDKDVRLFINLANYEKISAVIYKKEIKPYSYMTEAFDAFNQKIVMAILNKQKSIPTLSDLIGSVNVDTVEKINKQLKLIIAQQENFDLTKGINNVNNIYKNYQEKLR